MHRQVLMLVGTLLCMILLILAIDYVRGQVGPVACGDEAMETRARKAMHEGVDRAMRDQIARLYASWMRDKIGQPDRAAKGTYEAIDAYVYGRKAIDDWKLAPC